MNDQEAALVQVAHVLDAAGIPYMVVGGMANAIWGVPRATLDVDVIVWIDRVSKNSCTPLTAASGRLGHGQARKVQGVHSRTCPRPIRRRFGA